MFDFAVLYSIPERVSHLSDELERQMKKSNQSVDDLVAKTKISRGQIYLWKRSEQTSINEGQLAALAGALSESVEDHAALVAAHLFDEKFGPGSELVEIQTGGLPLLHDRPRPRSKGEQAMLFLGQERLRNRELNDLIIDLARMLGGFEPAPVRKKRKTVSRQKPDGAGHSPDEQIIEAVRKGDAPKGELK